MGLRHPILDLLCTISRDLLKRCYGVATISSLLEIMCLFCKRAMCYVQSVEILDLLCIISRDLTFEKISMRSLMTISTSLLTFENLQKSQISDNQ